MRPNYTQIRFRGSFVEYFITSVLLLILSTITVGLALPYAFYWSLKYFFTQLEIEGHRVKFTGHFAEYFFISLGLMLLSVLTVGLASPYWAYWTFKYFFDHLEVPRD